MELIKFILKNDSYCSTEPKVSDRMTAVRRFLSSDIGTNYKGYMKLMLEKTFSGEEEGFMTDTSDIEHIDADHVKLRSVFGRERDEYEASGTVIDKKQLYYLMDEWIRLTKMRVKEITITYDNGVYTIEGK